MKEDHRDHRSVRWLENLLRDFRYGMGALARDPGFAAVTIGLLALGIGANSAMFGIVDAVLLKPLPFPEPERMVRVWESHSGAAERHDNAHFSRLEAAERHLRGVVGGEFDASRANDRGLSGASSGQAGIGRLFSSVRREACKSGGPSRAAKIEPGAAACGGVEPRVLASAFCEEIPMF